MLVLVAFDLTRAMGMPADVVWVTDDTNEGLAELQKRAHEPWGATGHTPSQCEIVEVWRVHPAATWDEQTVRVCRLRRDGWETY